MIIEISLGTMHAVPDRKQMGHRFFGGGLAHRASDGDSGLAPLFPDCRRQRLQRDERVVDGQQASAVGIARQLIFPNHRSDGASA